MNKQLDKKDFYERVKLHQKYQVGDTYYYIADNKIKEAEIVRTDFNVHIGSDRKVYANFKITVQSGAGSTVSLEPVRLFDTKADAAESFLRDNNVPSELLKVLKGEKPKTTVGALIDKLNKVNPDLDLTGVYDLVLKRVSDVYIEQIETTDEFWDCNCDHYYIHPKTDERCIFCGSWRADCPDSRVSEITPDYLFKG